MKYTVMIVVLVIAGALALAQGELSSRREWQRNLVLQRQAVEVRRELAGLGVEALIRRSHYYCESNYDVLYCAEVERAIDAMPLQVVTIPPPTINLPLGRT